MGKTFDGMAMDAYHAFIRKYPEPHPGGMMTGRVDFHDVTLIEVPVEDQDEARRFDIQISDGRAIAVSGNCALLKNGKFRGIAYDR